MSRTYPGARTVDQVDDYHGRKVADPYRWMEDISDPGLGPWLDAQTALTDGFVGSVACRESFRARLAELSHRPGMSLPFSRGGRWFATRSSGEGKRWLELLDSPDAAEGRAVLDLSAEGDSVYTHVVVSPDGTKVLLASSVGGSDWNLWTVFDIDAERMLDDRIGDSKLWACWLPDSSGFFYIRFPSDGTGATRTTSLPQLWRHILGSADDVLVYENPASPSYYYPSVSADGRYLVMTFLYAPGSSVAWAPVDGPWEFVTIIDSPEPLWLVGTRDDTFFVATTEGAPYGRVVAIDARGGFPWRNVVPESSDAPLPMIGRAGLVGDHVLAARDYLGCSTVSMFAIDGSGSYDIELPGVCRFLNHGLDEVVTSTDDGTTIYLTVTRPTSPSTHLRHDVRSRTTAVVYEAQSVDVEIASEVVWTTSRDGTAVPMTIVRAASVPSGGPVIIEGYGGGGDSMEPYDFVPWKLAWLEAGGAVASAHIRGGGELGAAWQAAANRGPGKLLAMEDFIGCAQWLAANGTPVERIAITGRSSGGMLAAAAVVARPDAFASCVAEVGMFDPLRYHLFGLGSLMIAEYGTSEDETDFEGMYAYSPLHNVREGVAYPPILMTVHTDDDRVMPGGPYKFAAALQTACPEGTFLLRLRAGAGHHASADPEGDLDERSEILAFFGRTLGVPGC